MAKPVRAYLATPLVPRHWTHWIPLALTAFLAWLAWLQLSHPLGFIGPVFRWVFGQECTWSAAECTLSLVEGMPVSLPVAGAGAMLVIGAMLAALLEFLKQGGYKLPFYIQIALWVAVQIDAVRAGQPINVITVLGFFIYIAPVAFLAVSSWLVGRRWARDARRQG